MAIDFEVVRGDINFQANYSEPMFALWRSPDELFQLLFSELSRFGLQLNDLKWGQSTGIGDVQLNFFLFNYAVIVRVRVDRLEIDVVDSLKVNDQQLQNAATNLIRALMSHKPGLSLTAYVVAIAYHGKLAKGTAKGFTAALTAAPPDLGGVSAGTGAVFYYGPNEDRVSSAVTVDLSTLVSDALFFRTHVIWDASHIEVDNVAARTRVYAERVFSGFGLNPVAAK